MSTGSTPATSTNPLVRYIKEVRKEMKHIIWPTRQETIRLTVLVLVGSAIVGVLLALFDFGFTEGFKQLLNIRS